MVSPADGREEQALERYVAEHLVQTTDGDGRLVWTQEPAVTVRWAFISWEKSPGGPRT